MRIEIENPELAAALRAGAEALATAITNLAESVRYHANVTGTQQKRASLALERLAKVAEYETRVRGVTGFKLSFQNERVDSMAKKKYMIGSIKWDAVHPSEDVDHLVLTVVRDGVAESSDHDKGSTGVSFEALVGSTLALEIVKVDDSGKQSEPRTYGPVVVEDVIAPTAVEGFGVQFLSERVEEEAPAPEPEPAPPAPEPEPDPAPAPEEPLVD